ncbi:peptidoglycan-binding protein [Nonomuraea sp. NPDC052265]|uniref:peptidoglycan-binding protein n=1 Tax=Nonomuraea sp. NPDC052265 TaxID=3364374 RepID=UPI0037CCB712
MTGQDVRTWQAQMARRGWQIAVDGVFGAASQAVAAAFQREKGLPVSGRVNRGTWEAAWTAPTT